MFCKNCGKEINEGANFCKFCGFKNFNEVKSEENKENVENKDNYIFIDEEEQTIKIDAGRISLNGERQYTSILDIKGNNVILTSYFKSTKRPPKFQYEFKKEDISKIKYTRVLDETLIAKIRIILVIFSAALSVVYWPAISFALVFGLMVYIVDFWRAMIIMLKTGEKIKVYYNRKKDAKYVEQELLK